MPAHPKVLLAAVLASPPFAKAKLPRKLLEHLEKNWGTPVTSEDIWRNVLKGEGDHDGDRVRELVFRTRKKLEEFESVTESLNYFELPYGDSISPDGNAGYRLAMPERKQRRPTETFWREHTKSDSVRLVYPEPLFFYDIDTYQYIRFQDTNPREGSTQSALTELRSRHADYLSKHYGPDFESRLKPLRVFVTLGEVAALEMLGDWFFQRSYLKPRREVSDRLPGIRGGSPVLLGSTRTNRFIDNLLNSEEGRHFAYRLDETQIGFVRIVKARVDERAAVRKFEWCDRDEDLVVGQALTVSHVRDRLVVVQRMPMPVGRGCITMISSDTGIAIRQVALALTDDDQTDEIMAATKWTGEALPKSFEMLFSVRIAPTGIEHESKFAELVCFREYPST